MQKLTHSSFECIVPLRFEKPRHALLSNAGKMQHIRAIATEGTII